MTKCKTARVVQRPGLIFDVIQRRVRFQNELRVALMIVQRSLELPSRMSIAGRMRDRAARTHHDTGVRAVTISDQSPFVIVVDQKQVRTAPAAAGNRRDDGSP